MESIILSVDDVRALVRHVGIHPLMDEVIERLESVCLNFEASRYDLPTREGLADGSDGLIEWMPVGREQSEATIKIVGYHPSNPSVNRLPTILSVALTFDMTTGHLTGLSDATFATALRTGAASAVASRVLASPESERLGLIGAGAQALSQLHALARCFPLREVLVFDVDPAASRSFPARAMSLGLTGVKIRPAPLAEVTSRADILCTATSVQIGAESVFTDRDLQPHVHVNAVGSDFPGKTELPESLLRRSFVAADFIPQAMKEGECQRLERHEIGPDLVHLVKGADQFAAYRPRPTVFDSTGFALEDDVVIGVLHDHARRLGRGMRVQIESVSGDPANPYAFIGPHDLTMASDLSKRW